MSDWPDPTYFGFNGSPDPDTQLGYLRAAAGWLDSAETARSTDTPEADRAMWGAARLAELNIAMARAFGDHRSYEFQRKVAQAPLDVEAMGAALAAKMQADAEEFDAQTLRPGADLEPVAEGELWATGDGWFYYAVSAIPAAEAAGPGAGYVEKPRWLLARHYAQVLRWQSEQGTKPMAYTWSEVGHTRAPGEREVILRRPTAEERTAFYGPEPDPQPAIEETHERTTTIPAPSEAQQWVGGIVPQICPLCGGRHVGECTEAPPATSTDAAPLVADLWAFTSREGTALAELSTDELRVLQDTIARHIPVREGRQQPRGGAAQWREG